MRLSRAMLNMARWYALRTSSSLTTSLMRFQRSCCSSHWYALTATWVPSGFVSTSTSPTTALSGLRARVQTRRGHSVDNISENYGIVFYVYLHKFGMFLTMFFYVIKVKNVKLVNLKIVSMPQVTRSHCHITRI